MKRNSPENITVANENSLSAALSNQCFLPSNTRFFLCSLCAKQCRPVAVGSGVARGAGGPWPPGASLGGGAGPACRGEF